MEFGMHGLLYFMRFLSCLFPLVWIAVSIPALLMLRKRHLGEVALALWAILIVMVPILGAIAFWIISPNDEGGVG